MLDFYQGYVLFTTVSFYFIILALYGRSISPFGWFISLLRLPFATSPASSMPSPEARPRMLLSGIRSYHSQRTIPFKSFQPFIQTSIQAMMLQTIDVRFYR